MKKFLKRFFIAIFLMVIIACASCAVYAGLVISKAPKIDPSKIYDQLERDSYLLDADGKVFKELSYDENREIVKIGDMPPNLKNAFIAIEDKTFYQHHGFNWTRMIGAILSAIKGDGSISGTSTITQQLARNVYLPDIKSERSIKRKLIEMYYASVLERNLSKDEILEAYLNAIYLGYGSYGVRSASEAYFSKNVEDLSLAQCASLAALPQAPDTYALLQDGKPSDVSRGRRNLVLDLMVEQGYISREEADEANVDIKDILKPSKEKSDAEYTYFTDYVVNQVVEDLKKKGLSEETARRKVYSGGLTIKTTLDPDIQDAVYSEFQNDYNFPYAEEEPQAAMVVTEVGTGKVVAMMGGRKTEGSQLFNRAMSPRQPGSSIKPLSVYAAALQKSFEYQEKGEEFPFTDFKHDRQGITGWGKYITAGSQVTDERMYFNGELWPLNATRSFTGRQTFRTALQKSINTCAVKIQQQVGCDYSIETLKDFGISTVVEEGDVSDANPAALALGAMTHGVTPLEMATAYAVFPNGGVRKTPICYTKVTDADGEVVLSAKSKDVKVLDSGVAWIMTDVLKSAVSRGIAYDAAIPNAEVGGKTGTTNDNYDIWFDGFTPKYSASLWIGTDHNVRMASLSDTAARLWSRIMRQADNSGEYKGQPENVIYYGGEYYTKGTEGSSGSISQGNSPKKDSVPRNSNNEDISDLFEPID